MYSTCTPHIHTVIQWWLIKKIIIVHLFTYLLINLLIYTHMHTNNILLKLFLHTFAHLLFYLYFSIMLIVKISPYEKKKIYRIDGKIEFISLFCMRWNMIETKYNIALIYSIIWYHPWYFLDVLLNCKSFRISKELHNRFRRK